MTTIACDGRSMAADSQVTGGGQIVGSFRKVCRTRDGKLVHACTGNTTDCIKFGEWLDNRRANPKLGEGFAALVLTPTGQILYYHADLVPVEYMAPMAIGSGGDLALGAMLAGKEPREAVEIAIQRDVNSGGEVHVEYATVQKVVAA